MPLMSGRPPPPPEPKVERQYARDEAGLLAQLEDDNESVRRWAARDLGAFPGAAARLAGHLNRESETSVREAIFDALLRIGGEEATAAALPYLRSEDAGLRNGAVMVLQHLPDNVARHMEALLNDPDPDVRIFAIDILHELAHPRAPVWLAQVLERETEVNVIGSAVDRLAEFGTPEMLPQLQEVRRRFADYAYIGFAIDMAIDRISGSN